MTPVTLLAALVIMLSPVYASAGRPAPLDLSFSMDRTMNGLPEGWGSFAFQKIEKHTRYRLVEEEGIAAVHATAIASASGLVYSFEMDANARPFLSWKWKIRNTLLGGDARTKSGDDYAARIYVAFKYMKGRASLAQQLQYWLTKTVEGRYPPDSTLNYIWANRLEKGVSIVNPYTERSIMIAVESGNEHAGRWVDEKVNVAADYRRLFGKQPPPIEGIAIMTDSDNTGGRAEAWYAHLRLSAE